MLPGGVRGVARDGARRGVSAPARRVCSEASRVGRGAVRARPLRPRHWLCRRSDGGGGYGRGTKDADVHSIGEVGQRALPPVSDCRLQQHVHPAKAVRDGRPGDAPLGARHGRRERFGAGRDEPRLPDGDERVAHAPAPARARRERQVWHVHLLHPLVPRAPALHARPRHLHPLGAHHRWHRYHHDGARGEAHNGLELWDCGERRCCHNHRDVGGLLRSPRRGVRREPRQHARGTHARVPHGYGHLNYRRSRNHNPFSCISMGRSSHLL
mmetsp:Transcript_18793/g.61376  ORF Transcript_18793/g.61376 Transcript_18793/m.61376 type:complete len:269 (-) Transcript_18793:1253-2059(-)